MRETLEWVLSHPSQTCNTPFRSDPIGGFEPVPGCSFNSFYLIFIYSFIYLFVLFCKSVATRIPGLTRRVDPDQSSVYSDHFHLSYQNILFMSIRFRVFNYAETISNGKPITLYSYTIRLQNGVSCLYKMIYETIVQSLTLSFTKCHKFKRNDMHVTRYILIRRTLSMT